MTLSHAGQLSVRAISRITLHLNAFVLLLLLAFLTYGASVPALAQVSNTGLDQFGTFQRNQIQTINLYNLNNHIEIPITSKAARDLTFTAKFVWDLSDSFTLVPGDSPVSWQANDYMSVDESGTVTYTSEVISTNQFCSQSYRTEGTVIQFNAIIDQNNTGHNITVGPSQDPQILYGPGCPSGSATFSTYDGWLLNVTYTNSTTCYSENTCFSASITDPSGNVFNLEGSITDPNGNAVTVVGNTATDSTGNIVLSDELSYPVEGGTSAEWQFTYTSGYTYKNNTGCIPYQSSGSVSLTTGITLPDGSQYLFVFESASGTYPSTVITGRIHSITVPAGGTYTYSYSGGTNGVNCNDGKPAILTISGSDGSVWTYNRTVSTADPPNPTVTVVTDPACNDTVYTFDPYSGRQTQMQAYQGTAGTAHCSASTKTLLKTVVTCYNGAFTNCTVPSSTLPTPPIPPPSRVDAYTYLPGITNPSLSEQFYNSTGLVTQDNEFDFGVNTGAAPTTAPLQATMTTYATVGSNILNRPACIQTTSGFSPSTCGTETSTTTSITQDINYDSHGNVGTTKQWVSGSTYLSKAYTYTSTGLIKTMTDVNGAQTSYTYNACNGSYPDTISEPLSLSRTLTWDCFGGAATSVIDENSQTTAYAYYDPFRRVTKTTDPLGNTTTYTYTPTTMESVFAFVNPSCTTCAVDKLTTVDGLGRPYLQQTRQQPAPYANFDTAVTTYDKLGRVASVGIPCVSTASQPCSSAVTTTTYDAISRPQLVTDGGGGTTGYTYPSKDVLMTLGPAPSGENTKRRQLEHDALGRLTSVCEVTAGTTTWPGGTCAQNSSQTGYWTTYTHNALSFTVSENAQGTSQSRSYSYDGLSRFTSETNPENGTTNYTYDSDSSGQCPGTYKGDLVKRVDNAANVTCYTYDALHRKLSATYPSGPNAAGTPNKCFLYDAAIDGNTIGNAKGRLAEGYTTTSACSLTTLPSAITDEAFSYTARGELANYYQVNPNSSGYYSIPITYWANGVISTFGPFLTQPQYAVTKLDGEGRPQTIYGVTAYADNITYNAAGLPTQLQTSCAGSTCYPFNYTYDPNTLRMTQYSATFSNNGGTTVSGTLTWNPNGSLQQLLISDPLNSLDAQTCNYSADDLARLASVNCVNGSGTNVWAQNFTYDAFGNITKTVPANGTGINWNPGYNAATNHYTLGGTSYDSDGNVTNDSFNKYTWDAEGKPLSTYYGFGGTTWTFVYDAFGHQAEWAANGTYEESKITLGKFQLEAIGQTAFTANYPMVGGSIDSDGGGNTIINVTDWLGTVRAEMGYTGGAYGGATPHAPFGESYNYSGYPTEFTGEPSDTSVNNTTYYFPERQYRSSQGRWLSPDPAGLSAADPTNPQSWNRYAYALNNPLRFTDPTGLYCFYGGEGDTLGNDSDPTDYDFAATGPGDCGDGGQWIDTSTVVNVNSDGTEGPTFEDGQEIFPLIAANNGNCTASTGSTSIVTGNATTNTPTIAAGAAIGEFIGGPPGAFLGGILGSMFGVGGTASYVPSTKSLYAGPTVVFAPALMGGSGVSGTVSSVPASQNPNSIASSWDFSVTFQPNPILGSTVVKSPGSGPPVVGPSVGTRVPVSFGVSYSFPVKKGGC